MDKITAYQTVSSLIFTLALATLAPSRIRAQSQVSPQEILKAHGAWVKQSTPNASLEAKEVLRQGAAVEYHLFAKGLPSNVSYRLFTWPVTAAKPSMLMDGISIGKDGLLICAGREPDQCGDPTKKDDPVEFAFNPVKGEPLRLEIVSPSARAAIVIIPNPIQGKDKGCVLSVVRLTPNFELAYFSGSGFPPDSEVQVESQSYDEKHPITAKADAGGNVQFAFLPFVADHKKGTTTVKILGSQCSPALKFEWGN
jgi:hypothetical protein